jgi:hypothetical protein
MITYLLWLPEVACIIINISRSQNATKNQLCRVQHHFKTEKEMSTDKHSKFHKKKLYKNGSTCKAEMKTLIMQQNQKLNLIKLVNSLNHTELEFSQVL